MQLLTWPSCDSYDVDVCHTAEIYGPPRINFFSSMRNVTIILWSSVSIHGVQCVVSAFTIRVGAALERRLSTCQVVAGVFI